MTKQAQGRCWIRHSYRTQDSSDGSLSGDIPPSEPKLSWYCVLPCVRISFYLSSCLPPPLTEVRATLLCRLSTPSWLLSRASITSSPLNPFDGYSCLGICLLEQAKYQNDCLGMRVGVCGNVGGNRKMFFTFVSVVVPWLYSLVKTYWNVHVKWVCFIPP